MSTPLTDPKPNKPHEPLPPVEAPSASFLLQLFLIPLVIVIIIVMVWLLFSWLAHMGTNPRDLVRDIGRMNAGSWQKAYNLAELMRKPENEHLKQDPKLAKEIADMLTSLRAGRPERRKAAENETDVQRKTEKDTTYENRIMLEKFLCTILGEFKVTDGLPALITAAQPDESQDPQGFAVRVAAIGALAVQAKEQKPEVLREQPELMETLIEASKERSENGFAKEEYEKLRSAAAFTLGMVGSDEALERLSQMLDDPSDNARYNAALGLARHGDRRALETLYEMLDPANTKGLDDPDVSGTGQEAFLARGQEWKRVSVMSNAIRGARMLVAKNPDGDYRELIDALEKIEASDVVDKVQFEAKDLRLQLEQKAPAET